MPLVSFNDVKLATERLSIRTFDAITMLAALFNVSCKCFLQILDGRFRGSTMH